MIIDWLQEFNGRTWLELVDQTVKRVHKCIVQCIMSLCVNYIQRYTIITFNEVDIW